MSYCELHYLAKVKIFIPNHKLFLIKWHNEWINTYLKKISGIGHLSDHHQMEIKT